MNVYLVNTPVRSRARAPSLSAALLSASLAVACATDAKDRLELQQRAQRREARRTELQANAQARLAAGETALPLDHDPGYPVAKCLGVSPVPATLSYVGIPTVTCGNSAEGSQILAYREWYCGKADRVCALAEWSGGKPTFEGSFDSVLTLQWPAGNGQVYSVTLQDYDYLGPAK